MEGVEDVDRVIKVGQCLDQAVLMFSLMDGVIVFRMWGFIKVEWPCRLIILGHYQYYGNEVKHLSFQSLDVSLLGEARQPIQRLSCVSIGLVYDSARGMWNDWELVYGNLVGRLVARGANVAFCQSG